MGFWPLVGTTTVAWLLKWVLAPVVAVWYLWHDPQPALESCPDIPEDGNDQVINSISFERLLEPKISLKFMRTGRPLDLVSTGTSFGEVL